MKVIECYFVTGTATDGEFCSLRSKVRHALTSVAVNSNAKESISKCSRKTLLDKLEQVGSE